MGRFQHRGAVGGQLPAVEIKGRHRAQDHRCAHRHILRRERAPDRPQRFGLRPDGGTHRAGRALAILGPYRSRKILDLQKSSREGLEAGRLWRELDLRHRRRHGEARLIRPLLRWPRK